MSDFYHGEVGVPVDGIHQSLVVGPVGVDEFIGEVGRELHILELVHTFVDELHALDGKLVGDVVEDGVLFTIHQNAVMNFVRG